MRKNVGFAICATAVYRCLKVENRRKVLHSMKEQEINITFSNRRRRSINMCFLKLGASHNEVYPRNGKTFYEANQDVDLPNWARHLRRRKMMELHPDKHQDNKDMYTESAKEINEIFDAAKRILYYRGMWN